MNFRVRLRGWGLHFNHPGLSVVYESGLGQELLRRALDTARLAFESWPTIRDVVMPYLAEARGAAKSSCLPAPAAARAVADDVAAALFAAEGPSTEEDIARCVLERLGPLWGLNAAQWAAHLGSEPPPVAPATPFEPVEPGPEAPPISPVFEPSIPAPTP